ncbi:MAG: hypothetical protein ACJAZS_000560 [Alteromonas naphthalenivorans]|jgi:hypothetical protein
MKNLLLLSLLISQTIFCAENPELEAVNKAMKDLFTDESQTKLNKEKFDIAEDTLEEFLQTEQSDDNKFAAALLTHDIKELKKLFTTTMDPNKKIPINATQIVTPLALAAQSGYLELAQLLITKNADVNTPVSLNGESSITPLGVALYALADIEKLLLETGQHDDDGSLDSYRAIITLLNKHGAYKKITRL